MSANALVKPPNAEAIERVVVQGDLSKLSPEERVSYYNLVCESVGLNPLTKPFEYMRLNNRDVLYATKEAGAQLRKIHTVSVRIVGREVVNDCYVVTSQASLPNGRVDESIGAVSIANLKGEMLCNAIMKAETKSKRRVTLSICGLGMLDETELETIPQARLTEVPRTTEPIPIALPALPASTEPPTVQPEPEVTKPPKKQALTSAQKLHVRFKDALNEELKPDADRLLEGFLASKGYKDAEGRGSASMIPEADFKTVGPAALGLAQELNSFKGEEQ